MFRFLMAIGGFFLGLVTIFLPLRLRFFLTERLLHPLSYWAVGRFHFMQRFLMEGKGDT